jgi:hypothetical protein
MVSSSFLSRVVQLLLSILKQKNAASHRMPSQ